MRFCVIFGAVLRYFFILICGIAVFKTLSGLRLLQPLGRGFR